MARRRDDDERKREKRNSAVRKTGWKKKRGDGDESQPSRLRSATISPRISMGILVDCVILADPAVHGQLHDGAGQSGSMKPKWEPDHWKSS